MHEIQQFEARFAHHRKAVALSCNVNSKYRLRLFPGAEYDSGLLLGNLIMKYPRDEDGALVALYTCSYWLRTEMRELGAVSNSALVLAIAYCQCFAVLEETDMQAEIWEVLCHSAKQVNFHPNVKLSGEGQGKLGAFLAIYAVPKFGISACLDLRRHPEILQAMPVGHASSESIANQETSFKRFAASLLTGVPGRTAGRDLQ